MHHDVREALAAVNGPKKRRSQFTETTGKELQLNDPDETCEWFVAAALDVEAVLGVRLVNDFLHDANDLKANPEWYAGLLQLELALSNRDPYRQIAPLIHVIGRARG
jgi:hypothetical protein